MLEELSKDPCSTHNISRRKGLIDFGTLIPEIEAKLAFRGRTRNAMTRELSTKEARYKKLWAVRHGARFPRNVFDASVFFA